MWFQVTFGSAIPVYSVHVGHQEDMLKPGAGWPRSAQISYTSDGVHWEDVYTIPADENSPLGGHFNGTKTVKAIRITLTANSDAEPWSINAIELYGPQER
jgi:hypothetical protein